MSRRGLFFGGLVIVGTLWLVMAETACAVELGRLLPARQPRQTPAWSGNPRAIPIQSVHPQAYSAQGQSAGIPAPHRYPEYNQCSPWYGYGFGVPTYSWGYFGATYRPAVNCHHGYYGDFTQWGYRRGY